MLSLVTADGAHVNSQRSDRMRAWGLHNAAVISFLYEEPAFVKISPPWSRW